MRLKSVVHTAACFGLLVGAASAQDRAARFVERDRNRDGVLSRDEYTSTGGHPGNFRALDTNNDGVLSRSEFVNRAAGIEDDVVAEGAVAGGAVAGAPDPNVLTKVEFNKLDVNRDNLLTRTEWNGDVITFRKLDLNSDGYVSASEYVGAAPVTGAVGGYGSGSAENRFLVKDRNRDGLLTRAEYGVEAAPFDRVDRNDDGRVSYDEYLNQPAADSRQARFDELDRNNDGVVSRNEWRRESGVFHLADRNGDGVVTVREFLSAPAGETYEVRFEQIDLDDDGVIERREWPAGEAVTFDRADRNDDGAVTRWEFANSGAAEMPAEMSFEDMDHNNDGVVSRYEWHADRATFDRMDRNNDGTITYREFQNPLPADTRSSRFQTLDVNRDRKISRAEWPSDRESFAILDRNRDGMLTTYEYLDARGLLERFSLLDDNRDGALDRTEWGGTAATFRVLDRNRDGRVSRDEFVS
jgi:Ca2+-binding EF-hand superfamily protein